MKWDCATCAGRRSREHSLKHRQFVVSGVVSHIAAALIGRSLVLKLAELVVDLGTDEDGAIVRGAGRGRRYRGGGIFVKAVEPQRACEHRLRLERAAAPL